MKKPFLIALICAAVLVLGALVVFRPGGNGPSSALIDQSRAETLALDYFSQRHDPADSLSNVRILSDRQITSSSGRSVWEVQVAAGVTEPGASFTYETAMLLDVDAGSGSVTLVAAG